MNSKGYLEPVFDEPRFDALTALLRAVVTHLANHQIRLAIWVLEEFDLSPLDYQPIGAESPLGGSSSKLAGDGFLITLQSDQVDALVDALSDHLTYKILHLEIEAKGTVQFAAYDHFEYVPFGEEISLDLLEVLKARDVIRNYQLFDNVIKEFV